MTAAAFRLDDITEVTPEGRLRPSLHQGQREAVWSDARITLVLAGTQSGKTVCGPWWLLRQMRRYGPGDYIVAGPELTLLRKKVIPEIVNLFSGTLHAGRFTWSGDAKYVLDAHGDRQVHGFPQRKRTVVWFGHGDDPDSLESMTANAAWLDEPGQKKFRRDSYEAIGRRLSIAEGPMLLTTTPYVLHWLKTEVWDKREDPAAGVRVIGFDSLANPRFPRAEWERAQATLPRWKFSQFYKGRFERPAGMIYDCWDDAENLIPAFAIPDHWPRWLGLDFGGVNTAGLKIAQEMTTPAKPEERPRPTGRFVAYEEYHHGGRTGREHAAALLRGEPRIPRAVGGAGSEDHWRREFGAGGLPVAKPPVPDVEVGILNLYGLIAARRFLVFPSLVRLRDDVTSYGRVLDANGEPTEAIEDKASYHFADAARYFATLAALPPKRVGVR